HHNPVNRLLCRNQLQPKLLQPTKDAGYTGILAHLLQLRRKGCIRDRHREVVRARQPRLIDYYASSTILSADRVHKIGHGLVLTDKMEGIHPRQYFAAAGLTPRQFDRVAWLI